MKKREITKHKFTVIRNWKRRKKRNYGNGKLRDYINNKIIDKLRGHLPRPSFLKIFHFYSRVITGVHRNNHASDRIVFCMVIYYNLYRLQIGTYVAFLVRHFKRSGY